MVSASIDTRDDKRQDVLMGLSLLPEEGRVTCVQGRTQGITYRTERKSWNPEPPLPTNEGDGTDVTFLGTLAGCFDP
jgi:hypothetical protein